MHTSCAFGSWPISSTTLLCLQQHLRRPSLQSAHLIASSCRDLADKLGRCSQWNAMFDELLRMRSSTMSVRSVLKSMMVGGKEPRVGTKVSVQCHQLRFNAPVFGANAAIFNVECFLASKGSNRSPSYRPFGGRTTHCPGRFIAREEALAFSALDFKHFDIALYEVSDCSKVSLFQIEGGKPCLGLMGPRDG